MPVLETSEAVSFAETVAPDSDSELSYETDGPATIERLKIRFYPGQQLDHEIYVVIREKGSGRERNVVQTPGKDVFTGDDDVYDFELSKPLSADEQLVVRSVNTDPQYSYDTRVNAEMDYRGGSVNAIVNKLGGML